MRAVIVVPCFDEERRLQLDAFAELSADLLFVDDGSRDDTGPMLERWAASRGNAGVLRLPENVGKAEAVRAGLQRAIREGASVVGYLDADLATPIDELHELLRVLARPGVEVVLAARVGLLGRKIERERLRHWLGRVFATFASLILALPVYDTQCGAKVFAVTPALRAAVAEPFRARWAFDVELIGRLLYPSSGAAPVPPEAFVEVPLRRWVDVRGSKLTRRAMIAAGLDLVRIWSDLGARRRRLSG